MKSIVMVLMSLFLATTCHKKNKSAEVVNVVEVATPSDKALDAPQEETTKAEAAQTQPSQEKPRGIEAPKASGSLKDLQKHTQDNANMVTYEAFSRGLFLRATFSNNQVMVFKDRNNAEKGTKVVLSTAQINELNTLLKSIDPKTMGTLKAPTDKRLYDGAAHASLTMVVKGETYATPGFDHGAPPAAIEKFVTKLVSYTQDK